MGPLAMSATALTAARPAGPIPALLGLPRQPARTPFAVHDTLLAGLPASALRHAVEHVAVLRDQRHFEGVMAMSLRTYQRLKDDPERRLDVEASGRLWRFAEILVRAIDLLGSQEEAERWLLAPAVGLEQRRPIDLMATPTGTALVEQLLDRIDHGIYA